MLIVDCCYINNNNNMRGKKRLQEITVNTKFLFRYKSAFIPKVAIHVNNCDKTSSQCSTLIL